MVWAVAWTLFLLPLLLLALLQTPPGKALAASALSAGLSRSGHVEVRIEKIGGWFPMDATIGRLEVGDPDGVWLAVRDLHCRWRIRELVDGRIRLQRIGAEEVAMYRFPKAWANGGTRREAQPPNPMEVRLDGLSVKRLVLEKGIAGMPLEYAVHSGGITLLSSGRLSGGLDVTGDAEGHVDLDALLRGSPSDQLSIKGRIVQMNRPTFGMEHLSGEIDMTVSSAGVEGLVSADLKTGAQQGHVQARLQYKEPSLKLQQFQFTAPDFSAAGDLTLGFSDDRIDVALNSGFVDAVTNHYDVRGVGVVSTSNQTWGVDVQSLEVRGWEQVSFNLAGTLSPEEARLSGRFVEFDVGKLPFLGLSNFTGRVNGVLSISGPIDHPEVVAGMEVSGFTSRSELLDDLPELGFCVSGKVADGELSGATVLTNYGGGFLSAEFAMPLGLSIVPFKFNPQPANVRGRLGSDIDVGVLNDLAILENQNIKGHLRAELEYENRVPSGYLKFDEGHYEHFDWGLVFRDCTAELVAGRNGIEFRQAVLTDGQGGRMELTGGFQGGRFGIKLGLENAKVVQRPEIEARISGSIDLNGTLVRPEVSGKLVVNRAEILLDNIVSPEPPLLTDFDAYAETNATVAVEARKVSPVGMDVRIEMPDQIYVNASLVDSVWGGVLHLRDTPAGVSVEGAIEPRRGYVNFIGKKFRFVDGTVLADGAVPPQVVMDNLTAEYARSDFTARLVVAGRASDPQYRLESTPAMPEDEILSHVLFNRDTGSISAYQAYQIAVAAQQLSGGINGPGFMYQFRQAVGIDTLEWREADAVGGASSVAAGKYVTPELYIEVNSSLGEKAETGMSAEYEVSRHFSVETSAGPKMRPGIGLNWKNDY